MDLAQKAENLALFQRCFRYRHTRFQAALPLDRVTCSVSLYARSLDQMPSHQKAPAMSQHKPDEASKTEMIHSAILCKLAGNCCKAHTSACCTRQREKCSSETLVFNELRKTRSITETIAVPAAGVATRPSHLITPRRHHQVRSGRECLEN